MKKLKAVGIIAEYDPFHNGHLFQLKTAKEKTNADLVVVVMSSNWTQRGEPAIFDKWTRTQMALDNGVDLVIELPIQDAVQPAGIFATQAVKLINYLQCSFLSFGSEHADWDFNQFKKVNLNFELSFHKDYRKTYPQVFNQALQENLGLEINNPNDTLGFWYAQAAQKFNSNLELVPIDRKESNHSDENFSKEISSGKSIRMAIKNQQNDYLTYLPKSSINPNNLKPLFWDDFWPYLKYEITQISLSDLKEIYQMTDGLEYRFKKMALNANTFIEFVDAVKSKRYTYTRIQRLCVYVLFKMTVQNISECDSCLRILGTNQIGRQYLKQIKHECPVPIISKIDKNAFENQLYLECKAGTLTEMVNGKQQDLFQHSIII